MAKPHRKDRLYRETLSVPHDLQKKNKLIGITNADIEKLEEQASIYGYKYLKPYIEDIIHEKAQKDV